MPTVRTESTNTHDVDLTTTSKACSEGRHGWCTGRVYAWPENESGARLIPCSCGCGCTPDTPTTRTSADRTRKRQLAERGRKHN